MMKNLLAIIIFTLSTFAHSANYNLDEIRVYKNKHRMEMLYKGQVTKTYSVMLSRGGMAPKRKEGDKLVPEGKYFFDFKNPYSKFYRSIHITYPNLEDIERARQMGVNPGGDIFLHGMPNYYTDMATFLDKKTMDMVFPSIDWTAGCIAVSNKEMAEIWENLEVPLPVTIFH